MQTFKERAKEMDYSNLYYPYADKGPKLMRHWQNFLFTGITFGFLGFLAKLGANHFAKKPPEASDDMGAMINNTVNPLLKTAAPVLNIEPPTINISFNNIWELLLNIINFMCMMAMWVTVFISFIIFLVYLSNLIKRNREFERQVFKNDMEAATLYRRIQGSLKISKRLSEAKKAAYPKKSGSGGDNQLPSADNLSKVEELKYMKKMDIRVNTRQKLSSPKINTIYSIYLPLPMDETTTSNLLKRVENLNDTFTRLAKGKVTMGGYQITEDRQMIVFQGETPDLNDPYDYSDRLASIATVSNVVEYYQSAYNINNFVDRQSVIDEKKESAEEWAQRTGAMLDRYLITAKLKVTRLNTSVSSSKATYTYDIALDSNLSGGFNKFDEQIDKAFKMRGSSVNIVEGHLEIILPIPKEYHIPINVPTLYRIAFGDVEPEEK